MPSLDLSDLHQPSKSSVGSSLDAEAHTLGGGSSLSSKTVHRKSTTSSNARFSQAVNEWSVTSTDTAGKRRGRYCNGIDHRYAHHKVNLGTLPRASEVQRTGQDPRFLRLKREFERLDPDGDGIIDPHEIGAMMQRQGARGRMREAEHVVADLRRVFDHEESKHHDRAGIDFHQFSQLMLAEESILEARAGPVLATEILELKELLFNEEAHDLVTDIIRIAPEDLPQRTTRRETAMQVLENFINFVVVVNSVSIGVSTDVQWDGWDALDIMFAGIYVLELAIKLCAQGFTDYFCGFDCVWNQFDTMLVILAIVDVILIVFSPDLELPGFSVARILRLFRFVRLARVARSFKELSLMVAGLISGMKTLFWAFVIFFAMIYVLGVVLTQTVGIDTESPIADQEFFRSVPMSMFTVFRCLTGDCDGNEGASIVVELSRAHSTFIICYSLVVFFTFFGLFNLVAAIFVESTMTAAKFNDQKVALLRRKEHLRVAQKLEQLLGKFAAKGAEDVTIHLSRSNGKKPVGSGLCPSLWAKAWGYAIGTVEEEDHHVDIAEELSREQFEEILEDPVVQRLMDELDLSITDRSDLFDVLDGDRSGTISPQELIQGILKVRGEAKKSDTVATQLAVRSIQRSLGCFMDDYARNQSVMQAQVQTLLETCMPKQTGNKSMQPQVSEERRIAGFGLAAFREAAGDHQSSGTTPRRISSASSQVHQDNNNAFSNEGLSSLIVDSLRVVESRLRKLEISIEHATQQMQGHGKVAGETQKSAAEACMDSKLRDHSPYSSEGTHLAGISPELHTHFQRKSAMRRVSSKEKSDQIAATIQDPAFVSMQPPSDFACAEFISSSKAPAADAVGRTLRFAGSEGNGSSIFGVTFDEQVEHLGFEVAWSEDSFAEVVSIQPGSAASCLGIKERDIITACNGIPIARPSHDEVLRALEVRPLRLTLERRPDLHANGPPPQVHPAMNVQLQL